MTEAGCCFGNSCFALYFEFVSYLVLRASYFISRLILMGGALRFLLLLALITAAPAYAGQPRLTENVIVVTWDGFSWQELFTGAEAAVMDEKVGGVKDLRGLKSR